MNSRCLKPSCFDSSNVDMNSKGLYMYHISRKEKSVAVLCSRPRQNVKLARPFHVVVVQRRLRNVQKRVMHVQSCCFAILNLLLFCRSRCCRRRRCLSSLMYYIFTIINRFPVVIKFILCIKLWQFWKSSRFLW